MFGVDGVVRWLDGWGAFEVVVAVRMVLMCIVTLRLLSRRVVGNLRCGSEVRKRRKPDCFCRVYT